MASRKLAHGTVHKLPEDFRKAIESDVAAEGLWVDITPLARNEWICWVTSPKKEETRKRRIEVGIDKMRKGMRRPCCWPGCPHRQRERMFHDCDMLGRYLHAAVTVKF